MLVEWNVDLGEKPLCNVGHPQLFAEAADTNKADEWGAETLSRISEPPCLLDSPELGWRSTLPAFEETVRLSVLCRGIWINHFFQSLEYTESMVPHTNRLLFDY